MKNIFVVEDDPHLRELMEFLLTSQDYTVRSFPTAEDFKRGIRTGSPDLVLLDIMLPDGNGIDICKDLNENHDTNGIPVVLMSAHADPNIPEEVGAKDFIAKPFDSEDLFARIRRQLS